MLRLAKPLQNLINELEKLPGLGPRSASRIAFVLLKKPIPEIEQLVQSLLELKQNIKTCSICFNVAEADPCSICTDTLRDHQLICAVEQPLDLLAIERTEKFRGLYHVLGGSLNPTRGINPENLKMKELVARVRNNGIREIIVATNPTTEGEITALFLTKLLKNSSLDLENLKITRIARGVSTGSELEFIDDLTIIKALEGRSEYV